jgi:hypothetical protein
MRWCAFPLCLSENGKLKTAPQITKEVVSFICLGSIGWALPEKEKKDTDNNDMQSAKKGSETKKTISRAHDWEEHKGNADMWRIGSLNANGLGRREV